MTPQAISRLRNIAHEGSDSARLAAIAALNRAGVPVHQDDDMDAFVAKATFDVAPEINGVIPVESHQVNGRAVDVYRADLAAPGKSAPYIKCCIIPPFLDWAKARGYTCVGYYASAESFWVGTMMAACDKIGLGCVLTVPNLKKPPEWVPALGDRVHRLRPNMWHVNYNISRKLVTNQGGLMIPMGLDLPVFVALQKRFFDLHPLPEAQTYVVPTGSGTALSCVVLHLRDQASAIIPEIHGCVTRSVSGVRRILSGNGALYPNVHLHELGESTKLLGDAATFPVTKGWERVAYTWMHMNLVALPGPVCFLNLGR